MTKGSYGCTDQAPVQQNSYMMKHNRIPFAISLTFTLISYSLYAQSTNKIAYFASGCFWCVEAIYEHAIGVQEVISGYSGGHTNNPTYDSSNTGKTGHAEAVSVNYDPTVISFDQLVAIYFATQNPTQINGQGPDHGSQYRSILFYQNQEEENILKEKKAHLEKTLGKPVAAEIKAFEKFWKAESYHQNFERLHPEHPYIQKISIPRLRRFQKKFPNLVKK